MAKHDYYGLKKSHKMTLNKVEWVRNRLEQGATRKQAEMGWELAGQHGRLLLIGGEFVIALEHIKKRNAKREDPMDMYVARAEVIAVKDD